MKQRQVPAWAAFACVSLPALAFAQQKPPVRWVPASSANYTNATSRKIDLIVIHKVEGSLSSAASWFQNSSANVSAHFTVDGNEIVQSLDELDIGWHSGNSSTNRRSIGIENAGYTYRNDVSDAHLRRLASLVAYLCAKYSIPVDRRYIIGHNEVPHPSKPGRFGGVSGKTDPGPYWDWARFMDYVRQAAGSAPPSPPSPPTATKPSAPSRPASPSAPSMNRAVSVNVDLLNVRDGVWGTVIGQVPRDSAWVRTGAERSGFVEVRFRGGRGWLYAAYLTGYTGAGAEVTTDGLRVRAAPSMSATVLGNVDRGQIYAQGATSIDGQWVSIRYDQAARWVFKSFTRSVGLQP